jgi:formate C-acetyltransferase
METFEDVLEATKKQMDYLIDWHVAFTNIHEVNAREFMPLPAVSATIEGCMESGKDVMRGGATYNSYGIGGVGLGTLVDSLAVIKYVVYDKELLSAKEFYEAVISNWEGQEELRQRIHKMVPRFGNDLPYTDEIAKWVVDTYCQKISSCTGPRGHYTPGLYPVAMHVLFGMISWATPDGRKTGDAFSDGISPKQAMDKNGPLAVLKSTTAFDQSQALNGTLLNMKLHPTSLKGDGKEKLRSLINTYFDLGGMELQFNVVSADTLRAAQESPEEHQDLVVRIAGFSAYYVELYKNMQDDVIKRTEIAI